MAEPVDDEAVRFAYPFEHTTDEEWAALWAALDRVEEQGPPYADWVPSRRTESGAFTMPYPRYTPVVGALTSAISAAGLVVVFAWPDWHGFRAYEDPAALGDAPVEDALWMLTRTVRGERFSDGVIETELNAGRLQAAVRRVRDEVTRRT